MNSALLTFEAAWFLIFRAEGRQDSLYLSLPLAFVVPFRAD